MQYAARNSGKSGHVFCHVSSPLRTLHWFPISLGMKANILSRHSRIWLEVQESVHVRAHHPPPPTLASIPVPVSPSSSPTCLPRMHQVPAHRRVCAFDPFYTSLSSLPGFSLHFFITFGHTVQLLMFSLYLSTLTRIKHHKNRGFFISVHCCLPSTSDSVWHLVNSQSTVLEQMNGFSSYPLSNIIHS